LEDLLRWCLFLGVLALAFVVCAQRRVDPRNTYHRVICVVPLVGTGTAADPKRPQYAPWPASQNSKGIIAFYFEPTDDGKSAVAEFVAQDGAALLPLLNDKSIQAFEKGTAPQATVEAAIQQVRKDFSLEAFGMVMP
jgi:hypothetical protein